MVSDWLPAVLFRSHEWEQYDYNRLFLQGCPFWWKWWPRWRIKERRCCWRDNCKCYDRLYFFARWSGEWKEFVNFDAYWRTQVELLNLVWACLGILQLRAAYDQLKDGLLHNDHRCDRRVPQARPWEQDAGLYDRIFGEKSPVMHRYMASCRWVQSIGHKVLSEKQICAILEIEVSLLYWQERLWCNCTLQTDWQTKVKKQCI